MSLFSFRQSCECSGHVPHMASNIICLLLFGKRFGYQDDFIKTYVYNFTEINKPREWTLGLFCMIVSTVVSPLTTAIQQRPLPLMEKLKNMTSSLIKEQMKTRVTGQPRNYVDCFLDEMDKRADESKHFSSEELLMSCLNLHSAGTDTTSNTLLHCLPLPHDHPHIQWRHIQGKVLTSRGKVLTSRGKVLTSGVRSSHPGGSLLNVSSSERCQQEIDRVLQGKDSVTYDDRHNMPYVQAVVHESQRMADTVPLSVVHCTTRDTQLTGYSIPKGTIIIPNLSSALSEEGQWKFPHQFNPENFLSREGEFVKPDAFLPFSAGPRVCMGEGLARMELFLILVTLLRKFRFIWPEDAGEPDYELVFGATVTPKPYNMKVEMRDTQ
ncbi:hypothetical protein WMY93_032043 [Mugilogobius chulae]|uniref:Uncharacterized protein n=1 Tax=Mugilogobius chulae TaxID=88201 RepID=A0AAW0MET9_9GOBI